MKRLFARVLLRLIKSSQSRYLRFMGYLYAYDLQRRLAHYGNEVYIYYPFDITSPQTMSIGNNVHINRGAVIKAQGKVTIGDNVHIGQNLALYTVNHNYKGDALPYDHTVIKKPVSIERNVWIGINVTIVPGVTIGEGAIIGAGTVVSRDIPPLAIVGSVAPRIIKYRDKDHYAKLDEMRRYGGVSGKLYNAGENE